MYINKSFGSCGPRSKTSTNNLASDSTSIVISKQIEWTISIINKAKLETRFKFLSCSQKLDWFATVPFSFMCVCVDVCECFPASDGKEEEEIGYCCAWPFMVVSYGNGGWFVL